MFFSDNDILSRMNHLEIGIKPFDPARVQPASYDLSLGDDLVVYRAHEPGRVIDPRVSSEDLTYHVKLHPDPINAFHLYQGLFVLGVTAEEITLSDAVLAQLNGKSSLGRLGLVVHSTAGFVDPGWKGHLTLEISNANPTPIRLYPGMLIAQLVFAELQTPSTNPYGSADRPGKYRGNTGPRTSRSYLDFQRESA